MKKIVFILMFLSLYILGSSQVNNSQQVELLAKQIRQIKNSEMLLQCLINHAAKYEDFDSLYSIIEGVPCPKNFTYDLVNGDSSNSVKLSKGFLYLIGRNFLQPPFDLDQKNIKSINELLQIYKEDIEDPFSKMNNSYKKISNQIKNKIYFKLDSIEIPSSIIYQEEVQHIKIQRNVRAWGKNVSFRKDKMIFQYKDDSKSQIKNGLVVYSIRQTCASENSYWKQIKNQDDDFLKNDLGGSIIAKNISRYISAQVFNDILFFEINGRLVWIDVSP